MTARRLAIALAVIAGAGLVGLVCTRVGERGRYALSYSSESAGPDGARGAYLLAGSGGARVSRWAEDLGRLPAGATLIALGGCDHLSGRPVSRLEGEHLVRWIEAGGTLIVAGAPDYLPDALGVRLDAPPPEECLGEAGLVGMIVRASRAAERDAGVPDELAQVPDRMREDPIGTAAELAPEEGPPPLVWADGAAELAGIAVGLRRPARIAASVAVVPLLEREGAPLAVRIERGRGRVIVIASASPLQNRDLAGAEGAVMLARLLAGRGAPIVFDEHHLGAGARRGAMRYLAESGAAPIAIQIVIVILLALWWRGARFGAPLREVEAPPETTASFVSAIGGLLGRAGDPGGALAIVAREAIARIARHHHLDAHEPARLAELLRARRRDRAADAVLAIARRAGGGGDLVAAVRAIDGEIARALDERA